MWWKAIESIATELGIGSTETIRKWVRTAEVNAGEPPGVSSQERAEVRKLRAEVRELRFAQLEVVLPSLLGICRARGGRNL